MSDLKSYQIPKDKFEALPLFYKFVKYHERYIQEDNVSSMGVEVKKHRSKHFFPNGHYKPISKIVDYTVFNNDEHEEQ